uniref:Salivary lipocalin 2 n=1 Tax=Triatoma brasiliensis TaxID=65344 RepID=Q0MTE9_TRIBS|nr:salivary lipocalin 2 [Triatoma brasiliensis]
MKTFIALTFIGILTYAYGATTGISECQNVTPMERFSATQFFTGTWYVTHVQKNTSATVCQTFTTKDENRTLVVEYSFNDGQENSVRCEGQRGEEKKVAFKCKVNDVPKFDADFIILDTDYNDYALFYRCITFTSSGSKNDNYLVLRRSSGDQDIPTSLASLTSKLGLLACKDIRPPVA